MPYIRIQKFGERNMLNIDNSLFFLIDIQEKLVGMLENGVEIVKNNVIMAKTAEILNIPIIVSEQYPKGLGATVKELKEHIKSSDIVEKVSFSALNEELIQIKLCDSKRTNIILTGIETHICVYQTAEALLDKGFNVFVVKDACSSRKLKDYKTALELMRDYGAKLTCVETVLFELIKTSKHPNFREIQALIK